MLVLKLQSPLKILCFLLPSNGTILIKIIKFLNSGFFLIFKCILNNLINEADWLSNKLSQGHTLLDNCGKRTFL